MSKEMNTVVIGLIGTSLDMGLGKGRWEYWRPSVGITMQDDLLVNRFYLLHSEKSLKLARQVKEDILSVSPETNVILHTVDFENPWDFEEVYGGLLDFCNSITFDVDNNDYLIHITTGTHVAQICLFLLTESRHMPGKLLQSSPDGPRHKNIKGTFSVIDLDLSRYDKIASRFRQETSDDISFLKSGIETRDPAFNGLIEMIERVAVHSCEPILLTGPTGSGKSLLANRIYQLKKARNQVKGRFVEINCATLRGDIAMSALFGHNPGAFTGANQHRPGLLKAAENGIVFLDEIGELGIDEQAMLLRAIEEKRFMPLGADNEVESAFQLICGTNRDLFKKVEIGEFREDLLSRIDLWTFKMPGLKDRPEDIEPNLDFELKRYEEQSGIHFTFSREARQLFLQFAVSPHALWKSNFRDLNGAVIRMCTLAPGGRITLEVCRQEITRLKERWKTGEDSLQTDPSSLSSPHLDELIESRQLGQLDPFDYVQLAYVVEACRNARSLSEAGRIIFAHSRLKKVKSNDADRLRKYLAKFNLTWLQVAPHKKF